MNNESGCEFLRCELRFVIYSHESLVARSDLLNENVVFGLDERFNTAV